MADPGRRSRAWAVLAVSLALMALVTAISSSTGGRRDAPAVDTLANTTRGSGAVGSPQAVSARPGTVPKSPGIHARAAEHTARSAYVSRPYEMAGEHSGLSATSAAAPPTTPLDALFATSARGLPSASLAAFPATSPATRSTPAPGSAAPRSTAPVSQAEADGSMTTRSPSVSTSASAAAYPGDGSIVPPASSASFAAAGGGTVSAQAFWTGTTELELDISCPGGVSATRVGTSGLSLEVDDSRGAGTCTVTLTVPPGPQDAVSFTLVVAPAP
jgi:hypothetical protein